MHVFRRPFDYAARARRLWIGTSAGANVLVTPGTEALTLTTFAPTVSTPRLVTPGTATLTITAFAPTVSTPRLVTPGTAALTLATFAPTVSTPRLVTPGTATLTLTTFAPTVSTPRLVTPGTASLVLTAFAPTVTATANVIVTPGTATLTLTGFAPTVTSSETAAPGPTLTGVPGRIRRRPGVRDISGSGLIPIIGAGTLTAEACLEGDLLIVPFGFGGLFREAIRFLAAAIQTGASAAVAGEGLGRAWASVAPDAYGLVAGERYAAGVIPLALTATARAHVEREITGRLPIGSGAEAALTPMENEEALLIAAAYLLTARME